MIRKLLGDYFGSVERDKGYCIVTGKCIPFVYRAHSTCILMYNDWGTNPRHPRARNATNFSCNKGWSKRGETSVKYDKSKYFFLISLMFLYYKHL